MKMRELSAEERRRRTLEAMRFSPLETETPVEMTGRVSREPYAVGSKSEREAVVLRTPDRNWEIRTEDHSVWEQDPTLDKLVGHHVRLIGFPRGSTFVIREIGEIDQER